MFNKFLLLFFALAATSHLALADSAAQDALDTARKTIDIRAAGAKAFQLEADFTAQIDAADFKGHVTIRWSSDKLWSVETSMGTQHHLEIHKDDTTYTTRNTEATHLRIEQVEQLLIVPQNDSQNRWQAKKLKLHTESGLEIECVDLRLRVSDSFLDPERQVCINRVTSEIIKDVTKDSQGRKENQYADYRAFGAYRYPWQLDAFEEGHPTLEARIVSLEEKTFDATTFAPAEDAIARRHCANMKPPEATHMVDPILPEGTPRQMINTVITQVTISAKGAIEGIHVLQSAGPSLDRAAEEALRKWTFKSAMCGNEPVTADIKVEQTLHIK